MSQSGDYERWWLLVFVLLAVALVSGGSVLIFRHFSGAKPVEIAISSSPPASPVEIYLSGAVASEGIYTFDEDTSIRSVLQSAGGLTQEGEPIRVKMSVLCADDVPFSQAVEGKININTATAEELETLSGIGPVRAQAIIDYRNENGLFRTIDDLINVPGIGPKTLEAIRDQITVV